MKNFSYNIHFRRIRQVFAVTTSFVLSIQLSVSMGQLDTHWVDSRRT